MNAIRLATTLGLVLCADVLAGARIDLRPTPAIPPGGYQPNTNIRVDVYFVDTGNPQGAISFRGLFLDFVDTPPWGAGPGDFHFDGADGVPGNSDDRAFAWNSPLPNCGAAGCPLIQLPSSVVWVYPFATPNPLFQITMPDNSEVNVGNFFVKVGQVGGTLDAMNHDNPDPQFGARADFGFGGPFDPVITWRAYTGELTGGILEIPVVPEPNTLLLAIVSAYIAWPFGLFRGSRNGSQR